MKPFGFAVIARVLPFFLILLPAATALGQGERGALNGLVSDISGAVVPGAEVMAVNKDTAVETKAVTTDAGVYRLPYLPPGNYRVTASLPGFKTAIAETVVLHVGQTLTVDFKLEVGEVSERITVMAETPLLESGTAEVSRYVTKTEFDTWPIAVADGQRQIQTFIFSSLPGTVGGTFEGSINGGQYYSHEILIEGIPLGRFDLQGGSNNEFSPSADAVSEFKLQSGTMSAQYTGGQTSVANFAIKSGTNELHGAAFSYIQNDALRANAFNNNAINRERAPYKLFNWGYAVGGPVYLPKLYDGRNKTFFFTNLESTRVRDYNPGGFISLPVPRFKQGDFSQLFDPSFTGNTRSGSVVGTDALGRPIVFGQIYDPRTIRQVGDAVVRDPFPGNIIPQAMWSSVAKNILQQAPITDPIFPTMLNNYPSIGTCCPVFDEKILAIKGDHIISSNHRVSAYYNQTWRERNNSPGGRWGNPPGTPTGVYQLQSTPGRLARLAEDWTINKSLINHFAIGYNRFGNYNESVFVDQGWPEKIGLQNVDQTHFPQLFFDGLPIQGGGIGAGGRLGSGNRGFGYNGSWITQDDLTYIRGRHNFKFGFELRKYYYNNVGKSGSGDFRFDPITTQFPGSSDSTGHAFASFLLGAVRRTDRGITRTNPGYRVAQPGFYAMDDWKITRKLTLNLGLRWELISGYDEVVGRESGIDLYAPNPGAGNRPGALVFAEDLGRRGFQDWYKNMIAPRFGFAYAVSDRLVVRGGYGITNMPFVTNGFSFPDLFGYNGSISITSTNTPLRFLQDPVLYLDDRYPDFPGTLPNKDPAGKNGQGMIYIAPDSNRVGYTQNYNLGIQFQLPASTVLEVSYLGNKGTRLESNGLDQLDQLPVSMLALGDRLLEPLSANPGLAPLPYPGFNGRVAQALRGYPQYNGITQIFANFGTSHYDSLQVSLTRHLTNGLAVLGAYTWSKAITVGSDSAIDARASQDVYNRDLEKSLTLYHVPHFLKLTWIYDLPFGKGRRFSSDNRAVDLLLGGWTVTGIHNYRSGNPLAVSTSGFTTDGIFNGTFRPDVVAGVPQILNDNAPVGVGSGGPGDPYLNPAAFAQIPRSPNQVPLRLGTAPRILDIRGPHQFSEDFGVGKKFNFDEVRSFELRADFFNAFNRAGRADPVTNITSPLFGKITGSQRGPRNIQIEMRVTF
jgi:Carboxypeptidase regulatory-like domain